MVVNILLLILILLRLLITIRLFVNARQNNLPNLNWLAVHFLAQFIGLPFAPTAENPLGSFAFSIWFFIGINSLVSQVSLLGFNHLTFYKGRKSPLAWFSAVYIFTSLLTLYGILNSESNYNQSPFVAAYILTQFVAWGWHAWAASQAGASVAQEEAVEDWVKARYRMIVTYSILIIIGATASVIRILFAGGSSLSPLGNAMGLITLVLQIASVTMQFLVWVMPENFRQWLNRNQQAHSEERVHQHALSVLNILGDALSYDTGVSKMIAMYAIRKSISAQIQNEDSAKVEAHAVRMGYAEWMKTLNDPELYTLIKNSAAEANPRKALDNALNALAEKQSLFTMQAK